MTRKRFPFALLAFVIVAASAAARAQDPNAAVAADPLLDAVTRFDTKAVQQLLERGVSPDAKDAKNRSALFYAAQDGSINIVRLLLQHGADRSIKETEHGETALFAAARHNQVEVVRLLLSKGFSRLDVGMVAYYSKNWNNVAMLEAAMETYRFTPDDLGCLLDVSAGAPDVAARLRKAGATPLPRPGFVLDPKTLPDYVGRYRASTSDYEMSVSVADGSLQMSFGSRASKLLAVDDRRFVPEGVRGVVWTFGRESGKVVGATSRSIEEGDIHYRKVESTQP